MDCKKTMVILLAAISIFLPTTVLAVDFTVGGDSGWTLGINYTEWAEGKVFKVGDKLIFNYKSPHHNVVKADGANFKACTVPAGVVPLVSGQDEITFAMPGKKWYICSKADHCASGMKLVINVVPDVEGPAASRPASTSSSGKIATFRYQILIAVLAVTVAMAIVI